MLGQIAGTLTLLSACFLGIAPLSAQELAITSPHTPLNLSDPRLDVENLKRELARQAELEKELAGAKLQFSLLDLAGEAQSNDPKLDPRVREILQARLKQYQTEVEAYEKQWADERAADELFDVKVDAARKVARDHVNKLSRPREAGFKCTDPRDYERARTLTIGRFQAAILKQKYNLDWSPPPAEPAVTWWDIEELERQFANRTPK